jgi:hypothetical protein
MRRMQVVDATERWVDDRLRALASALDLPCPVRESFLFEADYAFYTQCTESDVALQRAAKRIFLHAGLPCDAVVVLWKPGLGQPARTDRDGDSWFLELDVVFKTNASGLGAILAREAARALIATRSIARAGHAVDDVDIDLAVMLAGLGPLALGHDVTYGALRPRLVRYVYARVCAALHIRLGRTLAAGRFDGSLKTYLVALWPRLSRTPLAFHALDSHVIIRCFCGRRLRVPTGARGTTTCPACKRKRAFDGRACRAAQQTAPAVLRPQAMPALTPWERVVSAVLDISLLARALTVLVVAVIAILIAIR